MHRSQPTGISGGTFQYLECMSRVQDRNDEFRLELSEFTVRCTNVWTKSVAGILWLQSTRTVCQTVRDLAYGLLYQERIRSSQMPLIPALQAPENTGSPYWKARERTIPHKCIPNSCSNRDRFLTRHYSSGSSHYSPITIIR